MNKVIKDQLKQVRALKIKFDDNTTKIMIPKTEEINNIVLDVGGYYLIKLEDFILNPPSNSTLSSNWNSGKVPKYKYYKVELIDKMSNMYKFNGIAFENGEDIYTENWFGWFPDNGFSVIEKL